MKRFYWKELLMLSAPVGVIALGLVFVKVRSGEPTSSLFAQWPDQPQITKCEVRPATPLEISRGAQFGVTMQMVAPYKTNPFFGFRYNISEIVSESPLEKGGLSNAWGDSNSIYHKAAHPLQQDYLMQEETESFNRRVLKSADGIIEVELKGGWHKKVPPMTDKVFRLDTKTIPLPDVMAARKANFRITKATLTMDYSATLDLEDYSEESHGLNSIFTCRTVGKWTMEGHPNALFKTYASGVGTIIKGDKTSKFLNFSIRFPTKKHPPFEGAKFRGLISINQGWPQEVTLEWPKKIVFDDTGPEVKFSTKLAPLPK